MLGGTSVGRHGDEQLRRFVAARASGDHAAMRRYWEALVIDFHDRMDGFVAMAHRGRLDGEEHDLAVAMSMARFATNLMGTFEGVSMGQLVKASQTLAHNICKDVQRRSVRERRHAGASLDRGWDGEEDGMAAAWEAAESARRFEEDEEDADRRDFLAWALPQVRSDNQRRAVELTLAGHELAEILSELGVSRDNAYQLRSRGFKDLRALKEQWDA